MRRITQFITILLFLLHCAVGKGDVTLEPIGNRMTLHLDGKPMLIIGGELGNSCSSSEADIAKHLAKCSRMGLNTVLVPVYWDLLEPEEGNFDFTLPDAILKEARKNDLKVVLLWFGAWKNSMSCYAPAWVKTDWKRFPRAHTSTGKSLEILSAFSENVFKADSTAFINLLTHLDKSDKDNTVLMIQIENEIGMLEDARDHSPAADSAYNDWSRGKGHVNGKSPEDDERFMAWHYGRYVGRLAEAARKVFKRPFYVNAAMNSRGRKPGEYPSAGPLAHLKDTWKAAAPEIDMLSPDIYDSGFTGWADIYAMPDNPLFIPEIRRSDDNPAQALYVFGEHGAVGFSPFSIENGDDSPDNRSVRGFNKLREWESLLLDARRHDITKGVYFDMDSVTRSIPIDIDSLRLTASHFFTLPWDPRATDGSRWPAGGAVITRLGPLEYLIAGTGIVVKFEQLNETSDHRVLGEDGFAAQGSGSVVDTDANVECQERIGILNCDEVDPDMLRLRRLSGDETHQGRHVRISPDDFSILHIKLYRYQ